MLQFHTYRGHLHSATEEQHLRVVGSQDLHESFADFVGGKDEAKVQKVKVDQLHNMLLKIE